MRRIPYAAVGVAFLFFLQSTLFFIIPSLGTAVFLSPDETAVAVVARAFGKTGSMRIEDGILAEAPWMHPRSFVTAGTAMVPVGFLGLPVIAGAVWKLLGEWGLAFFVPLLAVSAAYPLWRLTGAFNAPARIATVATWLSFPTVVLYANRGLFPNLVVVCMALWVSFLLTQNVRWARVLAGILAGFALAIRPIEAVWMIPWFVFFWTRGAQKRRADIGTILWVVVPIAAVLAGMAILAWKTYGSPFAVGYALRDPVVLQTARTDVAPSVTWPFGFHPRHVMFNVRSYLVGFLGPWTALAVIAAFVAWGTRRAEPVLWLSAWTVAALCLVYGQAIYQDHVGLNVPSFGNSFLRYLLPLAPLYAVATGAVVAWMTERWRGGAGVLVSAALVVCAVSLGSWTALSRDDEGVRAGAVELLRYISIRRETLEQLGPQAIVLSERSDKIFFPTFRVASPLPDRSMIRRLAAFAPVPVALFSSTLDDDAVASWKAEGMDVLPVFQTERETLYEIVAAPEP